SQDRGCGTAAAASAPVHTGARVRGAVALQGAHGGEADCPGRLAPLPRGAPPQRERSPRVCPAARVVARRAVQVTEPGTAAPARRGQTCTNPDGIPGLPASRSTVVRASPMDARPYSCSPACLLYGGPCALSRIGLCS